MKITHIRRRNKNITLTGSFQPDDLRTILEMADQGAFEPPQDPRIFNRRQPDGTFRPLSDFFALRAPESTHP